MHSTSPGSKRKRKSAKAIIESKPEWFTLIPGYDPLKDAGDCVFDPEAAWRVINFFSKCIRHVKGEKANKKEYFILEPWQEAIVANMFGWKKPDGTRRYREVFIFVPRKNGKTSIAAGLMLYVLYCDGEMGAECYSAAADRDQASLIYEQAKLMFELEPELSSRGKVYTVGKAITYDATGSSYRAISAEANTKHGYNSHFVLIDELHAQKDRDLVDVLVTSTGARKQPLICYITTSDFARESICNEKLDYAKRVRDGLTSDAAFLPVIYAADVKDDWKSEDIWRKANPNLGVSVNLDYLKRECLRAIEVPSYENTFKRLHLNIVTEQDIRWLQLDKWDLCGNKKYDIEDLRGRMCYAGFDLSSTSDLTAFLLLFPEFGNAVLPFFFAPKDSARQRERRDKVPYSQWNKDGFLEFTEGNVVDYDFLRRRINELGKVYDIKEIAIDRWNSTQLQNQLSGDGFNVIQYGQGFASMQSPTRELERLVLEGNLRHNGHPVLRWMAANVVVEMDAAGNMKPNKKKSTEKIDGIVALVMALGRANLRPTNTKSVYAERGVLTL